MAIKLLSEIRNEVATMLKGKTTELGIKAVNIKEKEPTLAKNHSVDQILVFAIPNEYAAGNFKSYITILIFIKGANKLETYDKAIALQQKVVILLDKVYRNNRGSELKMFTPVVDGEICKAEIEFCVHNKGADL